MKQYFSYQLSVISYHCLLFVIMANCLLFTSRAQTKMPADTGYYYTYGGTNIDEARDIKETPDKGYILAGTTSSFGPGAASVYMIKTDSLGKHIWSATQGGPQNDHASAIELTYDSVFFVAGYSNSFYTQNSFDYSAYYFKTDANGHLLWQNFVDNGANSFIYGACPVPADSGFILCGQTYATASGNADAYLIRVDKNGDTLWTRHYGDSLDEVFNSVCIMNNAIYAVGSNGSHAGADSLADGWVVKLNMNGNTIKTTYVTYGAHQQETLNGITPYNDSLFTVCGGDIHNEYNSTTAIITRYDTSLRITDTMTTKNFLSQDSTVNGYLVAFNKVVNISYGSVCVIGYAIGGLGGTNMYFEGFSRDGWLIAYTPPTNAYIYHAGGIDNDYGYSGIYTTGGKLIGVGSTDNFGSTPNFCTNPNLGLEDVFFVRFNTDSINSAVLSTSPQTNCFADTLYLSQANIKNYTNNNATIKLYPNPASDNINLSVTAANNEPYTAKVFSVLGEEIMSLKVNTNTSTGIDVSNLSNGTYIIKVQDGNQQNISILKFIISK